MPDAAAAAEPIYPHDDALIRPVAGRRAFAMGPVAVMVAAAGDLEQMLRLPPYGNARSGRLYMSRLVRPHDRNWPDLVGPVLGAPYAAMVLELIVARGVRTVLFAGWCGSISPDWRIGDVVVPTGAWPDEGTSRHYGMGGPQPCRPDGPLTGRLQQAAGSGVRHGLVWSTDAVFRETPRRIALYKKRGAGAVEMELSALMAVARFRKVQLAGTLVVSDELFAMKWRPGFRLPAFAEGRRRLRELALAVGRDLCHESHR